MKLTDCLMSKPFTHPDMIGAFCIIDGNHWVYRDCVDDFRDMDFIRKNCIGYYGLFGVTASDLIRDDWFNI